MTGDRLALETALHARLDALGALFFGREKYEAAVASEGQRLVRTPLGDLEPHIADGIDEAMGELADADREERASECEHPGIPRDYTVPREQLERLLGAILHDDQVAYCMDPVSTVSEVDDAIRVVGRLRGSTEGAAGAAGMTRGEAVRELLDMLGTDAHHEAMDAAVATAHARAAATPTPTPQVPDSPGLWRLRDKRWTDGDSVWLDVEVTRDRHGQLWYSESADRKTSVDFEGLVWGGPAQSASPSPEFPDAVGWWWLGRGPTGMADRPVHVAHYTSLDGALGFDADVFGKRGAKRVRSWSKWGVRCTRGAPDATQNQRTALAALAQLEERPPNDGSGVDMRVGQDGVLRTHFETAVQAKSRDALRDDGLRERVKALRTRAFANIDYGDPAGQVWDEVHDLLDDALAAG